MTTGVTNKPNKPRRSALSPPRLRGSFEPLQFFSGLESHRFARWNVYFFAGARIAADAGLPRLDAKDAEAPQFDALPAAERILERFEYRLDRLFRLRAADVWGRRIYDGIHDIQLDHTILPLSVAMLEVQRRRLSRRDG